MKFLLLLNLFLNFFKDNPKLINKNITIYSIRDKYFIIIILLFLFNHCVLSFLFPEYVSFFLLDRPYVIECMYTECKEDYYCYNYNCS